MSIETNEDLACMLVYLEMLYAVLGALFIASTCIYLFLGEFMLTLIMGCCFFITWNESEHIKEWQYIVGVPHDDPDPPHYPPEPILNTPSMGVFFV